MMIFCVCLPGIVEKTVNYHIILLLYFCGNPVHTKSVMIANYSRDTVVWFQRSKCRSCRGNASTSGSSSRSTSSRSTNVVRRSFRPGRRCCGCDRRTSSASVPRCDSIASTSSSATVAQAQRAAVCTSTGRARWSGGRISGSDGSRSSSGRNGRDIAEESAASVDQ